MVIDVCIVPGCERDCFICVVEQFGCDFHPSMPGRIRTKSHEKVFEQNERITLTHSHTPAHYKQWPQRSHSYNHSTCSHTDTNTNNDSPLVMFKQAMTRFHHFSLDGSTFSSAAEVQHAADARHCQQCALTRWLRLLSIVSQCLVFSATTTAQRLQTQSQNINS